MESNNIFSIGAGGMQNISVPANHEKNNLSIGTVLQLNGYNCPRYVIVENKGISDTTPHYGSRYNLVNLKDFTFKIESSYEFDHISTKKDNRIHMYYTNEVLPPDEVFSIWEEAKEKARNTAIQQAKNKEITDNRIAAGRMLLNRFIPADCPALIVAELETDDCDSQTDYFSTKRSGKVILGCSKHKRDIFSEMRKFAHKIPETVHLATAPATKENSEHPADEHREKYSMGAGYYLKTTGRYSTGWRISKYTKYGDKWGDDISISLADRCVFTDKEPPPEKAPEPAPEQKPEKVDNDTQKPDKEPQQPAAAPDLPAKAAEKTPPTIAEYKGHPTIQLPMTNGKGFTFGLSKAAAVLEYIDEIREFVEGGA